MKFNLSIFTLDKTDKRHKVIQRWHEVSAAKHDKHITSNVSWLPEMQAPLHARSETDTTMSQLMGNLVSSVSQGFSFTLTGRMNTIFLSGMSSKLLHFASTEDQPFCQLQVMLLTETQAPTKEPIDTSSVNIWYLGATTAKVWSSSYWKMRSPFSSKCFSSFQEWYLWSANTRNL